MKEKTQVTVFGEMRNSKEVSELLGIAERTVRFHAQNIGVTKIGRDYVFLPEDVEKIKAKVGNPGRPQKGNGEVIMISSCLLGVKCRWHGKISNSYFVKKWITQHPEAKIVSVCPEMLGGLPVPRPAAKRFHGRVFETCAEKENRKNITGKDITEYFERGAEETLRIAEENGITQAILCKWSPSCDINGITGRKLTKAGIKIINTF